MIKTNETRIKQFELLVAQQFEFLEHEYGYKAVGARVVGVDDPRERGVVARYSNKGMRIEIGWGFAENTISILLRLERTDVPRPERHVHLDPFVEFITEGRVASIVPQIYRGMGQSRMERILSERSILLESRFAVVVTSLAGRLREYLNTIMTASVDTIHGYHQWLLTRGETSKH